MPCRTRPLAIAVVSREPSLAELTTLVERSGHQVVYAAPATSDDRRLPMHCDAIVIAGGDPGKLTSARQAWPGAALVAVLETPDARSVTGALRNGAAGIVHADRLSDTLASTLAAVNCGQLCVPREFSDQAERPNLSMREKQILGMVVLGFANADIAKRLFVAESTVKSHLNAAFRKLGVRSRTEAAELILSPTNGLGVGILTIPTSDAGSANR